MLKQDKEGHYIVIKGSIHLEDLTITNIFTQWQNTYIYKTKTNRAKGRNKQPSDDSQRPHSQQWIHVQTENQ